MNEPLWRPGAAGLFSPLHPGTADADPCRADAYDALARAAQPDYRRLYEADRLLHETWFAAQDKLYL